MIRLAKFAHLNLRIAEIERSPSASPAVPA
jgi:hypothetical protein